MSRVLVTTDCLPAAVARSWLLVPAGRDDDVAAAEASAADAVVLDLEDGVADRNRAAARCTVARRLQMQHPVWVRISDITTGDWALDLDMLATAPPGRWPVWCSPKPKPANTSRSPRPDCPATCLSSP